MSNFYFSNRYPGGSCRTTFKKEYRILRYLIRDYWGRYLGWPDLLVYKGTDWFLAEVKASGDKLSDDQKRWIQDNYQHLHLPFKLVKIHKQGVAEATDAA